MRFSLSLSLSMLVLGLALAACSPERRDYGSGGTSSASSGAGGGSGCPMGTDDCDGDGECETNVVDNPEHCGGCNVACQLACKGTVCNDPVHIAAGFNHTCAVLAEGDLYCWGRNASRELGIDTNVDSPVPVKVPTAGPVVQVALGGGIFNDAAAQVEAAHTCAVLKDTTVQCWGSNSLGQLGTGSTGGPIGSPTKVVSLVKAVRVSAGGRHTCAVTEVGDLYCWGNNGSGQLGIGQVGNGEAAPKPVGNTVAAHVSAGAAHTCSLGIDGTLRCWGDNSWGRLGIGSQTDQPSPQLVSLATVERVTAGGQHTCALALGTVHCWGNGYSGQLGIENEFDWEEAPNVASKVPTAIFVAAGNEHTAAISGDGGSVYTWGNGPLGDGTTMSSYVPVKLDLADVAEVAAGQDHTCALTKKGQVLCWGNNASGQIGNGKIEPNQLTLTPTPVAWPAMP
jgi:alpha-tubulin suppressor-like RCC1 family protein